MGGEGRLLDPAKIPQPKIGKYLFYIAIVFLCWVSWYTMHAPPGFHY